MSLKRDCFICCRPLLCQNVLSKSQAISVQIAGPVETRAQNLIVFFLLAFFRAFLEVLRRSPSSSAATSSAAVHAKCSWAPSLVCWASLLSCCSVSWYEVMSYRWTEILTGMCIWAKAWIDVLEVEHVSNGKTSYHSCDMTCTCSPFANTVDSWSYTSNRANTIKHTFVLCLSEKRTYMGRIDSAVLLCKLVTHIVVPSACISQHI